MKVFSGLGVGKYVGDRVMSRFVGLMSCCVSVVSLLEIDM